MAERYISYPTDDKPREKCAVASVYGHEDAARTVFFALNELQHRGQDGSGIVSSDGHNLLEHKGIGLVVNVFNDHKLMDNLTGHIAVGHNRYRTSGGHSLGHIQPVTSEDMSFSLAHNGNIPPENLGKLESFLDDQGIESDGLNDSEMMHRAILYYKKKGASVAEAYQKAYPLFREGAFSLAMSDKNEMVIARDARGLRPLSYARLNGGYVAASETVAIDKLQGKETKDVHPGEMVIFNNNGVTQVEIEPGSLRLDAFELLYFSRPDSMLLGRRVQILREDLGKRLAYEHSVDADMVVGVPNSGTPAALGYANHSGIPFEQALIKNPYANRTFIEPNQDLRERRAGFKYNIIPEKVAGKSVIVVDDSIVRGTTTPNVVNLLREAGAKQIHMRIASPPVKYTDKYGIDMATSEELIAANKTPKEMKKDWGLDSLEYLSQYGFNRALKVDANTVSMHVFDGKYPWPTDNDGEKQVVWNGALNTNRRLAKVS